MITTTERMNSKKMGWKLLAAGLALAALSGTAAARDNVRFSISIGAPAPIYAPAPAYIYERPVYYSAPPVMYAPPRVVYYSEPAYYGPPGHAYGHRGGRDHGHGHRGWR